MQDKNLHDATVIGFGDEWERFDQTALTVEEHNQLFSRYFGIFPWDSLPADAVGFDLGCGSGRWAKLVAPKVGRLHCIDPSSALEVAKRNLAAFNNCIYHRASVDSIPLEDSSMDFGYSLGVLHHVPDTLAGIKACVSKLKPGAPFLVYLYYSFDNKPFWFKEIWRCSNLVRKVISQLPHGLRYFFSQIIAGLVYFPAAKIAGIMERMGIDVRNFPLSPYRNCSFYAMRTDALDRFGTRLEQRFSRAEISKMLQVSGLEGITFSENVPYWCAVGYRRGTGEA